jgi:hypothetical protein
MAITACIAGVGFFVFMLVVRALTRSDVGSGLIMPISFLYFAALFGICFMVLRYGSKAKGGAASVERVHNTGELDAPAYLQPAVNTAQLEEARDFGIGSVTDATTRTLDEVTVEKR